MMRVLISRPDRLGDVVLSTPLPREIKKRYPNSYVAVLVREYTKYIYVNNPYVDEIIVMDPSKINSFKEYVSAISIFRRYKFSHALMLLPNEKINYLLFLSGIQNRVGVGFKLFQFITGVKGVSRNKYIPLRNESDYCMDLARTLGLETTNIDSEIYLTENEKLESKRTREKLLDGKKYLIGIHTSSGNSAPNWEIEPYIELINKINSTTDMRVLITDMEVPDEIKSIDGLCFLYENKNLREDFIYFSGLDLLISASTGPMHICGALKVKTLSLFCPLTACSPKLWGPNGNDAEFILPEEDYCENKCPGDPKKCKLIGDGGVSPEKVFKRILKLFN